MRHLASLAGAFLAGAITVVALPGLADLGPRPRPRPTPPPRPAVVPAGSAELRSTPAGSARVELLAQGEEAFLGILELSPGAAVPPHRDGTEEYLYVLEGGGELTMEGETYTLAAGDTVFMPASALVSFQNGDAPMRLVQVFAGPESALKYRRWETVARE